jgi:phosphatidylserine/phosphatidylglycerophosphate/cardiolipin synthase-like enzyme
MRATRRTPCNLEGTLRGHTITRSLGLALLLSVGGLAPLATGCGADTEAPAANDTSTPPPGAPDPTPDDAEPAIADPPEPPETPPGTKPAAVTPKPGCVSAVTIAGHPAWLFFTRPDDPCTGAAGSGLDSNALDELTRLIDSVPAGGRIDGHLFSISVDGVAKALVAAQTRGVDVWISTDGAVATSTDTAKTTYLDQLTHKVYCSSATTNSCISTAADAISHTKLFVFSTATTPDGKTSNDVVWLGSANQTYASGMRLYNNTVTIYGDNPLFTQLRSYLDDLYARRTQADYYDPTSGRGHLLTASADVYISPELQTDLVVNRLDDITPDAQCEMRVIQASVRDSRIEVVNRLVALKAGGCKVTVVADTVEPQALAVLTNAGIKVWHKPIHDKSFIVYAKYGAAYEYRVYTGSHNLSGGSAHKYDEIFVKLPAEVGTQHALYDAYVTHFDDALKGAMPRN